MLKYIFPILLCLTVRAETISNPLNLDWPWELVHLKTNATGAVLVGDELRPAQSDGSNLWFIATLKKPVTVTITNATVQSPLRVAGDVVANGVYEFKFPFGGFRVAGDPNWHGQWTCDLPVKAEVIEQGPVFVKVRVRAAGYEALMRFVVGDPWIDVWEKYDRPAETKIWLELKGETVIWTPWFGHEGFKPIGTQQKHPLQPQEHQGSRPFVMMRPRWNQQPGSGQDFFVTRNETNAPAFGIVAVRPIEWVDPYAQTIAAYAENGDTARIKFPIKQGARNYAIVIGRREMFDGKLNSLVRRHSDWTLDDQMHKYILEWPRDPAKAGPHILLTREELQKIKGQPIEGDPKDVSAFLSGKLPKKPNPPSAQLWLERRYQDDFLNPTTYTRKIKGAFPLADLFADGQPFGGPAQAALGYIFTDLNHWPGWHNGWSPGNPNFHTDKYMVAIYAGAAMLDHPHARQWLDFGLTNYVEDLQKVFLEPDGVGYECPGYSGYSMGLQLEVARVFQNVGYGNLVATNPLWKKNLTWHRHLLTPFDVRLGLRHEAPIGDTHRWTSGGVNQAGKIARFYREADPAFAREMMAVHKLVGEKGSVLDELVYVDQSIPAAPLETLDWGSHAFAGFGCVMRTGFNTPRETFLTLKAGKAQGHYHNDELSFHYYGAGTPLALDYNCSYHPRGDHAALHNSMTFGRAGDYAGHPAQEQIFGAANVLAFQSTPAADVVVAERRSEKLVFSPLDPAHVRFGFEYPSRPAAVVHRRTLLLVKPAGYLVVRDETQTKEKQQLNIHLLAREVQQDGNLFRATGQWDTDALVYWATDVKPDFQLSRWWYYDEWMSGPGKYGKKGDPELAAWAKTVRDSDGAALIPPVGWKAEWKVGEYQQWLRFETPGSTPLLWVLYPKKHGDPEPKFSVAGNVLQVGSDEIVVNANEVRVNQTVIPLPLPPVGGVNANAPLVRDEAHQ